jgi:hypothetical protein
MKDGLVDIMEGSFKRLVAKKGLLSIGTTLLAGFYLIRLAFWAQNHDAYQATRLLHNGPAQAPKAPLPGLDRRPASFNAMAFRGQLPSAPPRQGGAS